MAGEDVRAELDALRAEVASLRAWQASHVCPLPTDCTCPSTAAATPTAPRPCPVHGPKVTWISPLNLCAGAAAYNPAITWMPGDPPLNIQYPTQGAAGCPSTLTYTVSAP